MLGMGFFNQQSVPRKTKSVITFGVLALFACQTTAGSEELNAPVAPATDASADATAALPNNANTKDAQAKDASLLKKEVTAGSGKINIYDESDLEASPPEKVRKHWFWLKHGPSFWKLRYYFAAQNASDCEFFYGLIQDNPLLGRASVDFNSASGCKCHGVGQVTHVPLKGGGAGQRGYIHVKCEDGRHMKGHFTTTSLTTGFAELTDDKERKFEATFGHSADQAVDKVNALRKKLGCPEVTAEEIETKVNAEILNRQKR
jgi:hypothetical protein